MEYIKTHKITFVALIVLLGLVVLLVQLKNTFMPNENGAAYGDRLSEIKKVEISKNLKNSIKKKLEETDGIKSASVRTQGRILRAVITVNDDIAAASSKGFADIVSNAIKDKQKKYYDVEVLIKKGNDDATFPIIGYKQHTKDNFTWTKDR